jgi:hypothetical protein
MSSVFRLAAPPSSSQLVNYMRSSWHSSSYGARTSFTKLQQMIAKSGIEARLGSLPLKLMHRVKEIELETAAALAKQVRFCEFKDQQTRKLLNSFPLAP